MRISDWSSDVCSSDLVLVVTLKYVLLILRADHHGEGGILALASLASRSTRNRKLRGALLLIGVCGATLFYGDGVITPAISVVGAMEGLEVVAPSLDRYVVSGSLVILIEIGRASCRERVCQYV